MRAHISISPESPSLGYDPGSGSFAKPSACAITDAHRHYNTNKCECNGH